TSDQNDDDFADIYDSEDDLDNEFCSDVDDEIERHIYESIESIIQNAIQSDLDPNVDESSRKGVIWAILKNLILIRKRHHRQINQ
ncbi:unnamed protein product, partial [Brachionus calyciflorus]